MVIYDGLCLIVVYDSLRITKISDEIRYEKTDVYAYKDKRH